MLSFQNFPCILLIHFTLNLSHFVFVDVVLTILPSWLRLWPLSAATLCVYIQQWFGLEESKNNSITTNVG